jgi:signal transduction histidine kinase
LGLAQEKEQLRTQGELERLRALSQMVAGVAHEVNTPLGIIQNAASLVTESLTLDSIAEMAKDDDARSTLGDLAEACQLIQKNVSVAARLVQSFKSLSVRQIADTRETADLLEVVKQGIDLYRYKARASGLQITIGCQLPDSERAWDGFPGNLSQVLLNLVTNVDRYAYPEKTGGRVEVTVAAATLPGDRPGFEVVVRDFGHGIPPENLARIFDPFFTTGRDRDGTGLGLSIVKNIMTSALMGSVRVESTVGAGTAFFLRFPKTVPQGAA